MYFHYFNQKHANIDYHRKVKELLDRISLLQAQLDRDAANYDLAISDKNRMIEELQEQLLFKDRKLNIVVSLERELDLLRSKYENDMTENSNLIRRLQFQLEEATRYRPIPLDIEVENITSSLNRARCECLHRGKGSAEVVYENNPYLIQQAESYRNDMLKAQAKEQEALLQIECLRDDNSRLRSLIDKLREGLDGYGPNFGDLNRPDNKTITDYVMSVRASIIDRAIEFVHRRKDKTIRELSFRMLNLYRQFNRVLRINREYEAEKNSRIEGAEKKSLLSVWNYLRNHLVEFLYDIFVRSTNEIDTKKKNSFMIFKLNMEEILRTHYPYLLLIVPVFEMYDAIIYLIGFMIQLGRSCLCIS